MARDKELEKQGGKKDNGRKNKMKEKEKKWESNMWG